MDTRRLAAPPALALWVFTLVGCDDSSLAASSETSADDLPALMLEPELRIGSLDDPELGFSRVGGIQVAEDGTMYVLEAQDRHVRIYDAEGRLVRRFGGSGSGPGEFLSPSAIQLVGDTVVVSELAGNSRITLFDRSGELTRTIQAQPLDVAVDAPTVRLMVRPYRLRTDGRFESQVSVLMMAGAGGALVRPDSVMAPRILFDAEGQPRDTAGWYAIHLGRTVSVGGVTLGVLVPLPSTELRTAVDSDTVIVERPAAVTPREGVFTVTRIREGGDTTYQRRLRYTPVPVEAAFRDSVIDARVRIYENRPQPVDVGAIRRTLESEVEWPAFHPPVSSVRVGSDGAVWLRREAAGTEPRWTVLNADGTPRGELLLPPTLTVHWSDGERLWGVERDAFEVQWLVRYRVSG